MNDKVLMADESPVHPLQTWGRKHNLTESQTPMTKQQMLDRARELSDEMDANDEENRMMQEELNELYKKLDAFGEHVNHKRG